MADTNSTLISTNTPAITGPASSLYYLHPSDNPGALITSVLLRGDNYSEWATKLSNWSIQAKQKFGFLNGSLPKPTTEPDLSRWLATNSMLVGWIRTSIDPKIRSTVTFVSDAHKLWETLQRRFSVRNGVRIHQLRDAIGSHTFSAIRIYSLNIGSQPQTLSISNSLLDYNTHISTCSSYYHTYSSNSNKRY